MGKRGGHRILNIFGKNLAVKIDTVTQNISNIWRLQFSNDFLSTGVELRISEIWLQYYWIASKSNGKAKIKSRAVE